MSAHDLFDETFGQLDNVRREQLDRAAATDPALADRRARLHRALALLLDDGDDPEPSDGLADRTMAMIAFQRERPRVLEFAPPAPRFRWTDMAVAATVLIAGLLALAPAILRSRSQADVLACGNNLRQVGLAMNQYGTAFGSYPYVNPDCPASYVGASFVQLHDAGYLPKSDVLNCPSGGCDALPDSLPAFPELHDREATRRGTCREDVRADYAYSLGCRDDHGTIGPIPIGLDDHIPLVADQPPFDLASSSDGAILDGNSPNHAGGGQNVLYTDGHVGWRRGRWISNDDTDLYLNQASRLAPGLHRRDAVITPAVLRFRR